jgi:hypothetical protein
VAALCWYINPDEPETIHEVPQSYSVLLNGIDPAKNQIEN